MKKVKISRVNTSLNDEYEVLVCSASFEDRSVCIPDKLKKKKFEKVIILENANGSDLIKNNSKLISELYKRSAVSVCVDYCDSISLADRIVKEINSVSTRGKKIKVL